MADRENAESAESKSGDEGRGLEGELSADYADYTDLGTRLTAEYAKYTEGPKARNVIARPEGPGSHHRGPKALKGRDKLTRITRIKHEFSDGSKRRGTGFGNMVNPGIRETRGRDFVAIE